MKTPDNFSGQLTEAIMKAFSYFNPNRVFAVNQAQYEKIFSHVYDTLHSTGLDERMSADYETLNAYKRQMRERYQDGIDVLEKEFPNGMYTKDKDGDLVTVQLQWGVGC